MGSKPVVKAIFGVKLEPSDWTTPTNEGLMILPKWEPFAYLPDLSVAEGACFMDLVSTSAKVFGNVKSFTTYGDAGIGGSYLGVLLWEETWAGESPPLRASDEARAELDRVLKVFDLDLEPHIYTLLSYG